MQWIVFSIGLLAIGLTSWIGISASLERDYITAGISLAVFGYLVLGFKTVQQEERRVVEFFGTYLMTLRPVSYVPGLRWILPGAMKIRATIRIWEIKIPLFEEPIKIDFRDGSATLKGAAGFVRVKNPDEPYALPQEKARLTGVFRAIYNIQNWRVAIKDLLENALRSYLNTLTIDEGLTAARAGYELLNRLPEEEQGRLQHTLARWGLELMQVTIGDFDLEPELVKARGEVHKRERAAEAAQHVRVQLARETIGYVIQMMAEATGRTFDEVQREVAANPELSEELKRFSEDLVTRRMSIDGHALTDIRVAGAGGDLAQTLMAMIAAIKKA